MTFVCAQAVVPTTYSPVSPITPYNSLPMVPGPLPIVQNPTPTVPMGTSSGMVQQLVLPSGCGSVIPTGGFNVSPMVVGTGSQVAPVVMNMNAGQMAVQPCIGTQPQGQMAVAPVYGGQMTVAVPMAQAVPVRAAAVALRVQLPDQPECTHNEWELLRTRKNRKILRCTICSSKWRFGADSSIKPCSMFSQGHCPRGDKCADLHLTKGGVGPFRENIRQPF
eukprot:Hpha_TRINITY_DN15745_c4_g1::TRINITY_DN15745_c4_g1_i1::g.38329::m.38329